MGREPLLGGISEDCRCVYPDKCFCSPGRGMNTTRDVVLTTHGKKYRWTQATQLRGRQITVVDVFEFRDGFTVRATDAGGEWLIDVALPDDFGVWREIEATPHLANQQPSGTVTPQE